MLTFLDMTLLERIERFCKQNELDYIDGIVQFCESNDIEVELVADLIKRDAVFTAKMQIEAEKLNFVKPSGSAKLPF
jgi:hypothetical protein